MLKVPIREATKLIEVTAEVAEVKEVTAEEAVAASAVVDATTMKVAITRTTASSNVAVTTRQIKPSKLSTAK